MATGKALDGKPYAGNPHVRFDEGEVAPAATPRRGSLLYIANHWQMKLKLIVAVGFVSTELWYLPLGVLGFSKAFIN